MTDESLFNAALALPASERPAFLDAHSPDAAVRKQVEELLAAADASNPLDRRPLDIDRTIHRTQAPPEPTASVGDRVGPYKLLEKIGEGGMGTVFMAEQEVPVRRKVALKIIKPGMDSKQVVARFEAERQALSMMDHPNIAKVLDAGTTASGRPYFVMELVHGVPITEFCDANKMTPQQRLELFVPICQAIQHAHMKGIIHRDIKPSNVLVTMYDDKPVPKVIDFGVAKAVEQRLTERTLFTQYGALVGTFEYMSPEQAEMNAFGVDTRSDVYSLGVLLYELLTGSTPLERARFRTAALGEVVRLIKEEEPPRPSQRLSTSVTLAKVAAARKTEPSKLAGLVRGELDWIVMRCLEKDRSRRYETATGLAKDVQRYLSGDAVEACPPTLGYRLRKAYRRNRAAVLVGLAFALMLLTGVALSSWLAVRATRAESAAEEKAQEAFHNLGKYEGALAVAKEAQYEAMAQKADAETIAKELQVDLDLLELKNDPRVGLLRLAETRMTYPEPFVLVAPDGSRKKWQSVGGTRWNEINEFIAAAVLSIGQQYAPLLPPITHDGHAVTRTETSPDRRTLLTFGDDGTARLWDARTHQAITILRREGEQVVDGGFSTDGKTIFTDDKAGVARFWEPDGKYRTQIPARPNYRVAIGSDRETDAFTTNVIGSDPPAKSKWIGRDRLLTQRQILRQDPENPNIHSLLGMNLVELWDTDTGKLVAKLPPTQSIRYYNFQGAGNWLTTNEGENAVLIYSAVNGKRVARLELPTDHRIGFVAGSPSGRRIGVTSHGPTTNAERFLKRYELRVWDSTSWHALPPSPVGGGSIRFLTDDLLHIQRLWGFDEPGEKYVLDLRSPGEGFGLTGEGSQPLLPSGDLVLTDGGRVYDTKTGNRLLPPPGKRFHPSVVKFAANGRFAVTSNLIIDTMTEKTIPSENWAGTPDLGSHLDIPPAVLQLWAQVAVRGELGPEGEFKKWDEATWEKKRQELAAVKEPYPDFTFPGYVATDKLHWLRAEFGEAKTEAEALRMATELLRRAEEMGNKAESVLWRDEVRKRTREVVPPPRPSK